MKPLRILIADDHPIVRQGLRRVIEEGRKEWTVCGEATTGREAVEKAKQLHPEIVVMDFSMPELNGLEATRQIRAALPRTEVLILTMHDSEQLVREVLTAGARGFILKSDAGHALVSALDALSEHKPFFTSKVSALEISVKTAETHRANIMRKLAVRSMAELVRYALREKIVEA